METWIKLYRKFSDWEWFNISEMVHLFIFLLLNANNSDNEWRGIKVKRGQLITGRKTLNEKTGISEQTLRTCLKRLENTKEITIKSTNQYSIITICNYESYQGGKNGTNQQTNQQLTSDQPATNQQLTTIKEVKNKKNDNNDNNKNADFVSIDFSDCFSMWLKYKSERRESYKSELSLKTCYNNLIKLSNNKPEIAKQIIEQSMANNWAGLFPVKVDKNEFGLKEKNRTYSEPQKF